MKTIRINKQRMEKLKKRSILQRYGERSSIKRNEEPDQILFSVLNAIQDGLTVMDTNYTILLQNETTRRLLKGQEGIGQPCYQVHFSRMEPCDNCHVVEAMETGRLVKKKELYVSDGPPVQTFEVYAYPVRNSTGTISGVVEYLRDITIHKNMEKQFAAINHIGLLANSSLELENVLNSILENTTRLVNTSVGMIFIKDPDTGRLSWGASLGLSEAFVDAFKKKPIQPGEGLTGTIAQTGKPIFIPEDSSNDPRITRSIVQKEELHSFLGVPIRAGDDIVGVMNILTRPPTLLSEVDLKIISIVSGQVGMAVRNAQLYQQQKEKEQESSLLISQMQLGFALHDIICDETGSPLDYRFLSVNDSFERLTGLKREDLVGRTVLEVLPGTEPHWIQNYGNVALTGTSRQFENHSAELGKYYRVNAYSPQPGQFAVIVDDVTEKRMASLHLAQAKEAAEAASRAKTQFLANMSHELRTPLNGLMGMLQLLETTALTEEQQEFVRIALEGSQSLTLVVGDILNYTGLERQMQHVVEEPFHLGELIQEVVALHRAAALRKGLSFGGHKESNLPGQLVGDRFKLKQILVNLVGNAVKFTETGAVHLSVTQNEEKTDRERIRVSFQVKDTGIGIPPEKLDYIFQQFTQADESHTRIYGGLGLGLAVARKEAVKLGGTITVDSTPGKGSVFTLICEVGVVPEVVAIAPKSESDGIYLPETQPKKIQVLVVDDDYASRLMAKLHLEKMGCRVETAVTGKEALEKIDLNQCHLVLMDCQMPVMNGYETARCIREREKNTPFHVPIVAMTARVLPGDREECLAAGMDGFLAKPFEREHLEAVIAEFVRDAMDVPG